MLTHERWPAQNVAAAVRAEHLVVKTRRERETSGVMNFNDFVVVILAAGKGTPLKSNLAKVLHRVGGQPFAVLL